jgi:hypothetical protein
MKGGLLKAYQFISGGETAVDLVRTYDNTVGDVFEANLMLVYASGGTHIKIEFMETGTENEPDSGIYTFAVDLSAVKEMEIL